VCLAVCLAVTALFVAAGCSSGNDPDSPAPVPPASDRPAAPERPPAGFTAFETAHVRLAHPAGFAVSGTPDSRAGGVRTVLAGPQPSPGSRPKIIIDEAEARTDPAVTAKANVAVYKARGGKVVSQREIDVPGAQGSAVRLEITANERLRDGTAVPVRTIELFMRASDGSTVTVSVLGFERDFEASGLRAVMSTVQAR
jgi:hypothetical protein